MTMDNAPDGTWVLLYFEEPRPWQVEADGFVLGFWSEEYKAWFHSEAANGPLNESHEPAAWYWLPVRGEK